MTNVVSLPIANWDQSCTAAEQEGALRAIESGNVLFLPQLRFSMLAGEDLLFSSRIAAKGKNVSLDPVRGTLRGMDVEEAELERLRGMMKRFADSCSDLLGNLLPSYTAGLQRARTSFRPVEIAGRSTSWRKDDTRLHVDSFPSAPTQGKRILRVFSNVNPHGQSRTWRLGESFEGVARRYLPSMAQPIWGTPELLHLLGITKSRRSHYDHFMLGLHDRMKADLAYQSEAAQSFHEFHTGSTWIVFSDQVSHAATSGQYALEQTFHVPVECMLEPQHAPLRILERLVGHPLT